MMNLATEFPPATRGTVVVWGLLAAYPFGGMTWQVLHHLAGLRALGFDVWYVEDSDRYVYDPETYCLTSDYVPNLKYLEDLMRRLQMEDRWVFRPTGSYEVCHGALDITGLEKLYREAEAVLNLSGAQELRDEHLESRCLVFIETDPVANQVAVSQGDKRLISELEKYDFLFTYGENLGAHDCRVPVERFKWYPTRPPVYTDWWAPPGPLPSGAAFTTISNWTHTGKDIAWDGESWAWRKDVEFKRFINVAAARGQPL